MAVVELRTSVIAGRLTVRLFKESNDFFSYVQDIETCPVVIRLE